jgi:hypothetical protein
MQPAVLQLFTLASATAMVSGAGLILGPYDPAPETENYIRLMPGQRESMIFDPAQLYNDTFLNQLLSTHGASRSTALSSTVENRATDIFVCNVDGPYATQAGVGRCAGLLLGLGNSTCKTTPGEPAVLCDVKEQGVRTVVRGLTLNGANQTAHCTDSSNGVVWIAKNCATTSKCVTTTNDTMCYMGGIGSTTGNGNFLMYVYGDGPL